VRAVRDLLPLGATCLLLMGCVAPPYDGYYPPLVYPAPVAPYGSYLQPDYRPYALPPPVPPGAGSMQRPYDGPQGYSPYTAPPGHDLGAGRFEDQRGYGYPSNPPYGGQPGALPDGGTSGYPQSNLPGYQPNPNNDAPFDRPGMERLTYPPEGGYPSYRHDEGSPEVNRPDDEGSSGLGRPTWR
jgi:hypothetical protein